MKTLIKIILTINIVMCLFACTKSTDTYTPSGAINVTNAVIGGATLTLNSNYNIAASTVSTNSYAFLPVQAGLNQINLYAAASPTTPYYNQAISISNADNYSLFLSGTSPAQVDATLIKESYQNYTDSLCGVRFINLSPGSNPVSVDIKGNANGSEVASIAYKAYSKFLQHPAKSVNPSYVFEFRDATTGNLITSYTLTTPRFHNVTLALRGIVGGSPAPGVILDNDF